jgi:hypothetical protein
MVDVKMLHARAISLKELIQHLLSQSDTSIYSINLCINDLNVIVKKLRKAKALAIPFRIIYVKGSQYTISYCRQCGLYMMGNRYDMINYPLCTECGGIDTKLFNITKEIRQITVDIDSSKHVLNTVLRRIKKLEEIPSYTSTSTFSLIDRS